VLIVPQAYEVSHHRNGRHSPTQGSP